MEVLPSLFGTTLSSNSMALILYFCGLRSKSVTHIQIKSVFCESNEICLSRSGCLLLLRGSQPSSWVFGEMLKNHKISVDNCGSLAGLLCRCSSVDPITSWTFEVGLLKEPPDSAKPMIIKIVCNTNEGVETGSQSIPIDSDGGELDIYYFCIRPTVLGASKTAPAMGFDLKPVGTHESPLLCVGHRGMGAEYLEVPDDRRWPENTLLSFHKAAQLGVPMVEFDVLPLRDSSDLAIYHNFNVMMEKTGLRRPCGCEEYKINIFDEPSTCNRNMVNLIPTFTPEELRNLKWGSHRKDCLKKATGSKSMEEEEEEEEEAKAAYIADPLVLNRDAPAAQYLPLFSQVLESVPTELAYDVELKYPQDTPYMAFKLVKEMGLKSETLGDFGYPSEYFSSINKMADNVIQALHNYGCGRGVVLSGFNPDLCLALRLKQSTFPILFISRGGIDKSWASYKASASTTELETPPHLIDPRHRSAAAVVEWAHLIGAAGVVINGQSIADSVVAKDVVGRLAAYKLACIAYGPSVSKRKFKSFAEEVGLSGICIDDVEKNAW